MERILRFEQGKQYTLRLLKFIHNNEIVTSHIEKINYPTTDSFGEKRHMQVIRNFMLCMHNDELACISVGRQIQTFIMNFHDKGKCNLFDLTVGVALHVDVQSKGGFADPKCKVIYREKFKIEKNEETRKMLTDPLVNPVIIGKEWASNYRGVVLGDKLGIV